MNIDKYSWDALTHEQAVEILKDIYNSTSQARVKNMIADRISVATYNSYLNQIHDSRVRKTIQARQI